MSRLLLTDSARPSDADSYEHVFSIEDQFRRVDTPTIIDLRNRVSRLEVPSPERLPYRLIWGRLARTEAPNLPRSIILFRQLNAYVSDRPDVTCVVCDSSVPGLFHQVGRDVAEHQHIDFIAVDPSPVRTTRTWVAVYLTLVAKLLLVLFDALVSIPMRLNPRRSDIVFVPAMGRLDSTLPVLEALDPPPVVATTWPTLHYLRRRRARREMAPHDPMTFHQFTSFGDLGQQLVDVVAVSLELFVRKRLQSELERAVFDEFGVTLNASIRYLLLETVLDFRVFRALLIRRATQTVLAESGCDKVVIGTLDPIGVAVMLESLRNGITVYHIPHSIATTYPPNPPTEVTQFVSGSLDVEYYTSTVPESLLWHLVPLGRPYLARLYHDFADKRIETSDDERPLRVLVATQNYSEEVRRAFIDDILNSVAGMDGMADVIIKPHPVEDPEFYSRFSRTHENVSVESTGLYEQLLAADIVVTINSNVGLEAVVVGTPSVCYNKWSPSHLDPTYVLGGGVRAIRSADALSAFFETLSPSRLRRIRSEQHEFLVENYVLDEHVAEDIANYIVSDSSGPTEC